MGDIARDKLRLQKSHPGWPRSTGLVLRVPFAVFERSLHASEN
jgi:hypothetical protein